MTVEQAVAFLEALGATQIRAKDNGWVESSCVLAPWTHKHHTDFTPSFGLSISPGERSYFLCFACRQGSAEELLHVLELYSKGTGQYDFARCHQILSEEQYVVPLPAYGEFTKPQQVFQEWPQYWLESFQSVSWVIDALKYLTFREVSATTIAQYDLRYDPKRQMIVAPYWDVYKRLAGARGRTIVDDGSKGPQKHYDYTFKSVNNARLVWYGEPVLNLPGPVVVVEGQFDLWRTVQAFPKTVANLTAKPTLEKMKKLGDCGMVIQIPDRDEAGQESVGRYAHFCQQLGLKHKVIRLDDGVKDPAECHPDYLRDKIQEQL
jgi:hypothetical protein